MGNKLSSEYVPAAESGAGPKKHFCIIGAGSSGLIIMKVRMVMTTYVLTVIALVWLYSLIRWRIF